MSVAAAVRMLRQRGERFHLVLADPPYAWDPTPLFESRRLLVMPLMTQGGLFALEHGKSYMPPTACGCLQLVTARQYGDSMIALYE